MSKAMTTTDLYQENKDWLKDNGYPTYTQLEALHKRSLVTLGGGINISANSFNSKAVAEGVTTGSLYPISHRLGFTVGFHDEYKRSTLSNGNSELSTEKQSDADFWKPIRHHYIVPADQTSRYDFSTKVQINN